MFGLFCMFGFKRKKSSVCSFWNVSFGMFGLDRFGMFGSERKKDSVCLVNRRKKRSLSSTPYVKNRLYVRLSMQETFLMLLGNINIVKKDPS